jgi:hypothetical protein
MKVRVSFIADVTIEGARVSKTNLIQAMEVAMESLNADLISDDLLDALAELDIEPDGLTIDIDEINVR